MSEQEPQNGQSENFDDYEDEGGDDVGGDVGGEYGGTSQQSSSKGVEEEDSHQEDQFSRIGESSDDPNQQRQYMEYLDLIKEIDCQNRIIEDMKSQIMELCAKPCKTRCEMKDIKRLRTCMEQENLKLHCLTNKAMNLQNFGSHRRYHDLPIATTLDEDNMAPYVGCIPPLSTNWKGGDSSENEKPCSAEKKDGGNMRDLLNTICKMKICCPEDKKLIQEIAAALLGNKKQKQSDPCKKSQRRQPPCSPCPPCPHHQRHQQQQPQQQEMMSADSLEKLKHKIMCMQSSVNTLKQEICKREKEKERHRERECEMNKGDCQEELDPIVQCGGKRSTKSDQLEKMKENYLYLLSEFAKRDCQLKELDMRVKGLCGSCDGGGKADDLKNADQSELKLLRTRVNELKEEQVEFKCIMKEQAQQLEDYRNKYLSAQQKVEEQSVTLEKLNMNNKRIEKQINTEIKEIRTKFQEKLNELLHFPKLLENEQLKLAQMSKEKDDLQNKLVLVCKELKALKSQIESPKENIDCRPQLAKCQMELTQKTSKLEEAERQRDLFCEQLKTTQDDLDTLRSESAKIIARTKERAEQIRQQQQEQIDRLEKELAQCRATACLSVSDREAVIREMQGQLNTLSYSFDAAQKQIKTLRNHIAYVSNENCFPVKC